MCRPFLDVRSCSYLKFLFTGRYFERPHTYVCTFNIFTCFVTLYNNHVHIHDMCRNFIYVLNGREVCRYSGWTQFSVVETGPNNDARIDQKDKDGTGRTSDKSRVIDLTRTIL